MAKADKVLQAVSLARMFKTSDNVKFTVASSNLSDKSFYAQINGVTVMEFESLKDADKVVDALNVAVQSVMDTFKSDYDSKIGAILA